MWIILIIEILVISIFYRRELYNFFFGINFRKVFNELQEILKNNYIDNKIIIIISAVIFFFYCSLFFANIGTIFYFTDTLISWNVWAKTFANNILPLEISHYPQLLPANWSIRCSRCSICFTDIKICHLFEI